MNINEQNKLFFENQTKVGRVISHLEVKCPNCWTSYYYTGQQMSRHGNHVFEKACKCQNQSEHIYKAKRRTSKRSSNYSHGSKRLHAKKRWSNLCWKSGIRR